MYYGACDNILLCNLVVISVAFNFRVRNIPNEWTGRPTTTIGGYRTCWITIFYDHVGTRTANEEYIIKKKYTDSADIVGDTII